MSNPDFKKGDGAKIAIKFTEDLVGSVDGNKAAFTVEGKEYQYVGGPLLDGDYQVDEVIWHPPALYWQDDFSGEMDGVEVGAGGVRLVSLVRHALSFNGNGNNVRIPLTGWPTSLAAATIEFTAKPENNSKNNSIIMADPIGGNRLNIHFPWQGVVYWDFGDYLSGGRVSASYSSAWYGEEANWRFTAGSSGMSIVRNSMTVASGSGHSTFAKNDRSLLLGGDWKGTFRNLRIWSVETASDMETSLAGDEAGLLAYYPIDEGEGTVLYDKGPLGNDGIINGASWVEVGGD